MPIEDILKELGIENVENDIVENIKSTVLTDLSDEDATNLLSNGKVKSLHDSKVSKLYDDWKNKFESDELPKRIKDEREKLMKELNPELTEEQKELRELKSQVDSLKSEKMRNELEKELRAKAKELGYPVDRAGRFSIYGDKAFSMLENEAEYLKSIVSDSLETEIKSRFGGETPKNGETKKTELTRAEYDNLTNAQKADFVKNGGKIK